ncbi:MAG: HAMP domain-containing sensor histidine kinase [Candidatus Eisenbacteria bacterium]|nr:HAMP domain-containing sensor histidine kinase [Candidatus Eisenbacteria bacterium]
MPQQSPRWRRHGLWLAFLAVLAPLGILLFLQYRTLRRLQDVSQTAQAAVFDNYLGAIVSEIRYFYLTRAETVLNVSSSALAAQNLEEIRRGWQRADLNGVKRLYLLTDAAPTNQQLLIFDPVEQDFTTAVDLRESQSILRGATLWVTGVSTSGDQKDSPRLRVDERDTDFRQIMKPILDDEGQAIGMAGMVLDEDYVKRALLPMAIQNALPTYFQDASRNDIMLRIRDLDDRIIMGTRRTDVAGPPIRLSFPFVFRDWTLEIQGATPAPAQLLQANFALWITLSLLVAGVLAVAIALALSAAARTMQLSEMKTDFVSNVSHELRTPVASIRVFGELLRGGRVQSMEKVREYGAAIESESRRLSDLIDNVLDFARIESGQKTYRPVSADLTPLVGTVLDAFRGRLHNSGHDVVVEMPHGPLPAVDIDADAFGLALNNLLDNAVKYSGDSRRVFLRLLSSPGSVIIEVEDEGIGIPEEEQAKIFERFHRVGTGSVHDVKGSGLGLAIVQHIMKAHHGRVVVDSKPGRGSIFRLHFPVARTHPATGANTETMTARRASVTEVDHQMTEVDHQVTEVDHQMTEVDRSMSEPDPRVGRG